MQQIKKISSIFFLSIFTMFMLHQVLPHVHHEHELVSETEASEHHHSHAHDHQKTEHQQNRESNSHSGLLESLIGNHTHTYHSNDLDVRNTAKQQIKVKEFSTFTLQVFHTFLFEKESEPNRFIVYQPPGNFDFYFTTPSLRGPPSLG